jgi:ectoine hydroxylase-related dioxygenase (phytanoyl-CoA dioxygenase family)
MKITNKDDSLILGELNKYGVSVVEDVFSEDKCDEWVTILEEILQEKIKKNHYFGSNRSQAIYNYFLYDQELYNILIEPLICRIMTSLIGEDYVPITPSARNPRLRADLPEGKKTSGHGWHVDSRPINSASNKLHMPSLMFYAVLALEDFNEKNAATCYVERSHLKYEAPHDREMTVEHSTLRAKKGSIIFFDSALWHRVGDITEASRWSIFNAFGPWYMKPYWRFCENVDLQELKKMPDQLRRILHLNSLVPKNTHQGISTVTKEPSYDRI